MTLKTLTAVIAAMLMAIAGISVLTDDYADVYASDGIVELEYSVAYKVGEKTYTVPYASATVTLATLGALGASAPAGTEFAAWTDETNLYAAGSTLIISSETKTATLTATFKAITYTATFFSFDGKELDTVKGVTKTVGADGVTVIDAIPTDLASEAAKIDVSRPGYIFAGWDVGDSVIQTKDLGLLTASAEYKATYTVDYNVVFIDGDKTYRTTVSALVIPDVGEKTGYIFIGWFVDGKHADPATYDYKADTTFIAKWQNINCYVTFVAGDETVSVVPVLFGETVVEPKLPAGYVSWDFDFTKAIVEDTTVKAIPAAPAKPTGLNDPIVLSAIIIGSLVVLAFIALLYHKVKVGEWVIGRKKEGVE